MRKSIIAVSLALAATTTLSACGSDEGSASTEGLDVVASFYPLQYATERIGGDLVNVEPLTQPGQEPHDLELSIQRVAEIADADLAVYLEGFQPAVDEAIETNPPAEALDVHDAADLVEYAEGEHDHEHEGEEHSEEEHSEEEGHDHEGEEHSEAEHSEEEGHDHDHGDEDPHFWLDPTRMASVASAIADELSELDPDNASTYAANLESFQAELTDLDTAYADGLANCEITTAVVSHDAFGYLTKYGVEFHGIAGLSPDAEPSLAKIQELREVIEEDGVNTVFYERLVSPATSESLAADLDIDTGVLDTIEGLTDETSGDDYLTLMESNLEALRAAGGC